MTDEKALDNFGVRFGRIAVDNDCLCNSYDSFDGQRKEKLPIMGPEDMGLSDDIDKWIQVTLESCADYADDFNRDIEPIMVHN